jgi:hypothetical protein
VLLDEGLADGQAQPHALSNLLGREERLEDVRQVITSEIIELIRDGKSAAEITSSATASSRSIRRSCRTHFALFQKYRWGTRSRAGPPCSGASGAPSYFTATHALPRVTSASGRLVV